MTALFGRSKKLIPILVKASQISVRKRDVVMCRRSRFSSTNSFAEGKASSSERRLSFKANICLALQSVQLYVLRTVK